MKNLKDIIIEKLVINKNTKIIKKMITEKEFKPFNTFKNVDDYVERMYEGFGIKLKNNIKTWLGKYINGRILLYEVKKYCNGLEIDSIIKNDLERINEETFSLAIFGDHNYIVHKYYDQHIIYMTSKKDTYILVEEKTN